MIAGNASLSACAGIALRPFALARQFLPAPFLILAGELSSALVVLDTAFHVAGMLVQQVRPLMGLPVNKRVDLGALGEIEAGHHEANFFVASIFKIDGALRFFGKALRAGFLAHGFAYRAPHALETARLLRTLRDRAPRLLLGEVVNGLGGCGFLTLLQFRHLAGMAGLLLLQCRAVLLHDGAAQRLDMQALDVRVWLRRCGLALGGLWFLMGWFGGVDLRLA